MFGYWIEDVVVFGSPRAAASKGIGGKKERQEFVARSARPDKVIRDRLFIERGKKLGGRGKKWPSRRTPTQRIMIWSFLKKS
jgi:hypothetical protein